MCYLCVGSTNIVSDSDINSRYGLAAQEGNLVLAANTETMRACLSACPACVNTGRSSDPTVLSVKTSLVGYAVMSGPSEIV